MLVSPLSWHCLLPNDMDSTAQGRAPRSLLPMEYKLDHQAVLESQHLAEKAEAGKKGFWEQVPVYGQQVISEFILKVRSWPLNTWPTFHPRQSLSVIRVYPFKRRWPSSPLRKESHGRIPTAMNDYSVGNTCMTGVWPKAWVADMSEVWVTGCVVINVCHRYLFVFCLRVWEF